MIVQADVQKDSFVAALDRRPARSCGARRAADVPTWSTPAVYSSKGGAQVIVNGWNHIGGYDLATGKEVWRMTGGGDIPVPTPISAHGLIFITSAHGGKSPVYAVQAQRRG